MINWKVRLKHKQFWLSITAALLVLANQVSSLFGSDITVYNDQITNTVETVLSLLAIMGVVIDPTTKGLSDSEQALNYSELKE